MAKEGGLKSVLKDSGGKKILLWVGGFAAVAIGMFVYTVNQSGQVSDKAISAGAINQVPTQGYTPRAKEESSQFYKEELAKAEQARVERKRAQGDVAVETAPFNALEDYGPQVRALEEKTDKIIEEQKRIQQALQELAAGARAAGGGNDRENTVVIPYMKNQYGSFALPQLAEKRAANAAQILTELKPFPTASVVDVGIRPQTKQQETQSGNATGTQEAAAASGNSSAPKSVLQKLGVIPGDILFGFLETEINSDFPGPVVATVSDERLPQGTKAFGGFKTLSNTDGMIVQFNRLVFPDGKSVAINAYAVDLGLKNYNVADDVDRHLLLKLGATFAVAWIQGIGQAKLAAITASGTQRAATPISAITRPDGTIVYQYDNARNSVVNQTSDRDAAIAGLAAAGQELSAQVKQLASRPTTFRKYAGSSFGLLIVE